MDPRASERRRMVEEQLRARGLRDPSVLAAMGSVPRERFVPEGFEDRAYADGPLPIGGGQTLSQPYVVAAMIERLGLTAGDRALEIGVGSGYAAAVLSRLAGEVYGVEFLAELAAQARERLAALGFHNVHVRTGDGRRGWPEHAPYQGILVSAAAEEIPSPLLEQLAPGGRLVAPVGPVGEVQHLVQVSRDTTGSYRRETLEPVMFVPLVAGEPGSP